MKKRYSKRKKSFGLCLNRENVNAALLLLCPKVLYLGRFLSLVNVVVQFYPSLQQLGQFYYLELLFELSKRDLIRSCQVAWLPCFNPLVNPSGTKLVDLLFHLGRVLRIELL